MSETSSRYERSTRSAYLITSLLEAPFWTIYGMLIFILCKELKAPLYQYTTLIALKPAVSLLTPYWSHLIYKRPDRLRSNIILAELIGHIPFLLFPFIHSTWYIVFAGAIFLAMKRCIIPAWMEILKLYLPKETRAKTFSSGATLSFVASIALPFALGKWLDIHPGSWRELFPLCALINLAGTAFLLRIPKENVPSEQSNKTPPSIKEFLLVPWKHTIRLFFTRPDFMRFQLGFMLGGGGLMLMQPALPPFFSKVLELSYTDIAVAIASCKGIGFALTSRLWAKGIDKTTPYLFSAMVILLSIFFPIGLWFGKIHVYWVFAAYIIYGVMQAGSKLAWNLSGPLFAGKEDSTVYSSVNVVSVGIRGMIAPVLGSLLVGSFSPSVALFAGGAFCLLATAQLTWEHFRVKAAATTVAN